MNTTFAGQSDASGDAVSPGQAQRAGRPVVGLSLLGLSAAFSLALLVYFGAWTASAKSAEREGKAVQGQPAGDDAALWENGVRWACPLH